MLIRHRLGVAALVPPLVRRLHDPRLGVGEVDLVLGVGDRLGRRGRGRRFPLGLAASGLLGRLDPGPFLQQFPGRLDLRQPALTASQLVGQLVAVTVGAMLDVLGLIGGLGVGQELGDLLLEPRPLRPSSGRSSWPCAARRWP